MGTNSSAATARPSSPDRRRQRRGITWKKVENQFNTRVLSPLRTSGSPTLCVLLLLVLDIEHLAWYGVCSERSRAPTANTTMNRDVAQLRTRAAYLQSFSTLFCTMAEKASARAKKPLRDARPRRSPFTWYPAFSQYRLRSQSGELALCFLRAQPRSTHPAETG